MKRPLYVQPSDIAGILLMPEIALAVLYAYPILLSRLPRRQASFLFLIMIDRDHRKMHVAWTKFGLGERGDPSLKHCLLPGRRGPARSDSGTGCGNRGLFRLQLEPGPVPAPGTAAQGKKGDQGWLRGPGGNPRQPKVGGCPGRFFCLWRGGGHL